MIALLALSSAAGSVFVAFVVGGLALVGTTVAGHMNRAAQREEKQQEYEIRKQEREDEREEDRKQLEEVARVAAEQQEQVAERLSAQQEKVADRLSKRQDETANALKEVATTTAETRGQMSDRLAELKIVADATHDLVNSQMDTQKKLLLAAAERELVGLLEIVSLKKDAGKKPTAKVLGAIKAVEANIVDLKKEVALRGAALKLSEAQEAAAEALKGSEGPKGGNGHTVIVVEGATGVTGATGPPASA